MRIREKIENCKRIIAMTKKPDFKEFYSVSRICAIGLLIVGLIGFLIFLIANIKELI
ncbi:MAG: protein translocase SEC61 complex subunit gamma [Candidatus Aenigmatarchaeota archaeon]